MSEDQPRRNRKSSRGKSQQKEVDPLFYAGYFEDHEDIAKIEEMFDMLEEKENNNQADQTDAARKLFCETATPEQLPIELWFEIQDKEGGKDDDVDSLFNPLGDFDDDEDTYTSRSPYGSTRVRSSRASHSSRQAITTATQIEHLGAGVELWPAYKIESLDSPDSGPITHKGFPNTVEFISREEFLRNTHKAKYHQVPDLDAKTFLSIVGKQIDLILMDPPYGHNGWNAKKLRTFLHEIKPKLSRTFIVSWTDPQHLSATVEAFQANEYIFCDSIAVELLDELLEPYNVVDPTGFPRNSRMAIMFRTNDIVRSDLKQQRVKDTGYGIVQRKAKSYNRVSMPDTVHNIAETMLPPRKGEPRVFVELWPAFFDRRPGWILIDEIVVSEDKETPPQSESTDDQTSGTFTYQDQGNEFNDADD